MAIQDATPEMGKYLRQIVDNAFEEAQFESGIAMLDQLRSPDHKPSIIHILHLLFIALHSDSHEVRLDESGTDPVHDSAALLLQSPRKIVKQSKSALVLSPQTVLASQNLLFAFISTNSPQDIATALPSYPNTEVRRQVNIGGEGGAQFAFDYLDSPIYNQSAAIRNARSVWELLKEGYANRAMQKFGTPKVRKGSSMRSLGRDASFNMDTEVGEAKVVGEDSWFLLEWLVALFEKDAEVTQSKGMQKHSPLLLRQLPPPPLNTNTRWDASEPLKIVAFAIQQSDWRRQRIGLRLLNLFIDLSQTPYLNVSSLASTALAQFASSSSAGTSSRNSPSRPEDLCTISSPSPHPLTRLFSLLSSTSATLAFKILLCQKILQDLDGVMTSSIPHQAPKASIRLSMNSNKVDGVNPFAPSPTSDRPQLVSALKRPTPTPRILPRPRTSARVSAAPQETNDSEATPPQPVTPIKSVESAIPVAILPADSTSNADATTPTNGLSLSTPITIVPPPRPRLPPFADVSKLAKVQPRNEASLGAPSQANGRSRTTRTAQSQRTVQTPWAAPGLLLRVKFELLLACATLMMRMRAEHEAEQSELASRPDIIDWTQSLSDGRMHELILVVFGPQTSCSSEEEAAEKAFYADTIRAVVGFPIDAT